MAPNNRSTVDALFDSPVIRIGLVPALVGAAGFWMNSSLLSHLSPVKEDMIRLSAALTDSIRSINKLESRVDAYQAEMADLRVKLATMAHDMDALQEKKGR